MLSFSIIICSMHSKEHKLLFNINCPAMPLSGVNLVCLCLIIDIGTLQTILPILSESLSILYPRPAS